MLAPPARAVGGPQRPHTLLTGSDPLEGGRGFPRRFSFACGWNSRASDQGGAMATTVTGTERTAEVTWRGNLTEGSGTIESVGSGAFGPLPVSWAARAEQPDGQTSPEEL